MEKHLKGGHELDRRRAVRGLIGVACLVLLSGCTTAYVGIGAIVVAVGAASLAFQCDEPVSVSVWAPTTAYAVCDAEVVATDGKHSVTFSPCYASTLGEGTWTVTATKPGFSPATGVVTVDRDHRCTEPTRHSLELSLGGGPRPYVPPEAPTGAIPGAVAPPVGPATSPEPGPPAVAPAAQPPGSVPIEPAPAPPAGTAPKASFPPATGHQN